MNKYKLYMLLSISILIISILGSFAWYNWSSTNNALVNLEVCTPTITFAGGSTINGTNIIPVLSKEQGIRKNININTETSCTKEGIVDLFLELTTLPTELADSTFVYELYKNSELLTSGNFANKEQGDTITLVESQTLTTNEEIYTLYIYIDGTKDNDVNMAGKSFTFQLYGKGTGALLISSSEETLSRLNVLNSSIAVDTSKTPDFSKVSGDVGYLDGGSTEVSGDGTNGIYVSEDDDGTSYYFRGTAENNYVVFGAFLWRIIRINGDGSVRIIYNGEVTENGTYNISYGIGQTAYNTNYNDNAYVGYMYGTADSSTYEATHSNTNSSTIKTYVDNWYNNNLASYEEYIQSTTYCNDRSITAVGTIGNYTYNGNGIGTSVTSYSGFKRNYNDNPATPSLKCTNTNDKLTLKIGLITSDEVILAGAKGADFANNSYTKNADFYLYSGSDWYWTMTPTAFVDGRTIVDRVYNGYLNRHAVRDADGSVRPVVSLKSDAISGGQGTYANPFTVG